LYHYHFFIASKPLSEYDNEDVALSCILFASKLEDTPRKLRDICYAAKHVLKQEQEGEVHILITERGEGERTILTPAFFLLVDSQEQARKHRERILDYEKQLLELIGFNFLLEHPHQYVIKYARQLGGFN